MSCDQRDPQVLFCLEKLCEQESEYVNSITKSIYSDEFEIHKSYKQRLYKIHQIFDKKPNPLHNKLHPIIEHPLPNHLTKIIEEYTAPSIYDIGFFKPKELDTVESKLIDKDRSCSLSCVIS